MKVEQTDIEGVLLIKPTVFSDNRGSFFESWTQKNYRDHGIYDDFVQDNLSVSSKNVIRGLHFQKDQAQMVTVVKGEVLDVLVDVRRSSPTFGQHLKINLSAKYPSQIYMPPGIAHGFCVLADEAILHYKCSQYYDPQSEGGVLWNDPALSIDWPVENPIISDKDSNHKVLEDAV